MLKAIETTYHGYRFRSRLEARWAYFLDEMGAHYRYELQGFDVAGTWYLPDFYLTENDVWLEVKPDKPDNPELYQAFAKHIGRPIVVLCGDPVDSTNLLYLPDGSCNWACFSRRGLEFTSCLELTWHHEVYPNQAAQAARQARFEHGENN